MLKITESEVAKFKDYLIKEEKSCSTVEKYVRDVEAFGRWLSGREVTKNEVIEYKKELCTAYAPKSINAALSSVNAFFEFEDAVDCKVKMLKIQKNMYVEKEKELTKTEYERLLTAAKKKNEKMYVIIQTIAGTGIRVSEDIYCKG